MRKWLPYLEAMVVLLFIVLMFLYTKGAGTEAISPSLTQAQAFIKQGDADFARQDLVRALVAYWRAIQSVEMSKQEWSDRTDRLDKSLLHAHLRVAEIYFHSNWNEDSEAHLEHVAKIQPDHFGVHLLRGKLLFGYGEKAAATEEFLHVLEKDSTHPEACYTLGLLYQGAKHYKEAIYYHKQAIKNDPALVQLPFEPAPIGLLARLQLSRTYRRIVQDFEYVDRDLTAAELTEIGELTDNAIAILEEVVANRPNFTEAKEDLINLLYDQAQGLERGVGDVRFYDEALKVYEHIVDLDPSRIDAWQKMGEINHAFRQDPEAALRAYQKAHQLYPDPSVLAAIKSLEEDLQNLVPK
jgi:tetratricopeptide (TPR) repeat protein